MRRGFTLIELLIVLAIIVIVSGMAVAIIRKPLERQEIQKAANTVRTKLFRARVGAMRSNHVYTFQYMPGSGQYRLAPDDTSSAQQADSTAGDNSKSAGGQGQSADDEIRPEEGTLPEGTCIMPDNSPDPEAAEMGVQNGPQNEPQNGGGEGGWSDPIYFYPDGTTSDARMIVASNKGFMIPIRIRGVTGNVVQGAVTKRTM